jgi:hypothetical protein
MKPTERSLQYALRQFGSCLVLTPLILTQPEDVALQPTVVVSEENGLEGGWEGVEAMDMVR